MKLLHTSDWHFGKLMPTGNDYEEDQRYFLDSLCDLIDREQIGAVLCSGDIYDSARVKGEAIQLFSEAATKICKEKGIPLIVIAGNHDSPSRLSAYSQLLTKSGLHITGRIQRDPQPLLLDNGKVAIYSVPHYERCEVINLFPEKEDEIKNMIDASRVLFDNIRQNMSKERRNIVLSHCHVTGAMLSESDQAARIGHAAAIPMDIFEGFDYVALGHIHKEQSIAPHIRYSGSPFSYSFGLEEDQEKGVVLLDTDTMEQIFEPIPLKRKRKTLRETYEEILTRDQYRDHYVKILITDRYRSRELLEELERHFDHIVECYGKNFGEKPEDHALSLQELQGMKDEDILRSFFRTYYHSYDLTEEDIRLFCDALQETGEEEAE